MRHTHTSLTPWRDYHTHAQCFMLPWRSTNKMAAAQGGGGNEKEPVNIVHRNAIFCETIHKEQRHQKLYTHYGVNPYKKSKDPAFSPSLFGPR